MSCATVEGVKKKATQTAREKIVLELTVVIIMKNIVEYIVIERTQIISLWKSK